MGEELFDAFAGHDPGLGDAAKVVGGYEAGVIGHFAGVASEKLEAACLHALLQNDAGFLSATGGEERTQLGFFVGDANGTNAMFFGQAQSNFEKTGEHLDVFVPVEMCGNNSGSADFVNLGVPFALNLGEFQGAAGDAKKQVFGAGFQIA